MNSKQKFLIQNEQKNFKFLVALGPILVTINLGMTEGYSAILLPQLEKEMEGGMDQDLASWIASMAALPMALGCILGGVLMEKIGRKTVHMACCIPCILGWLIIYFANSTFLILAGRFLTGFCVGFLGPPTGVYMAETSEPKFRGFLLATISFAIAFGIFLSHLIGTFLSWQNTALLSCVFPVLSLILMFFVPESPTWLAKVGRKDQAIAAFRWCRGQNPESENELRILIERQKLSNEASEHEATLKVFIKKEFYKPLFVIVVFFIGCQWSGINSIAFYSISIIEETVSQSFDSYLAMLILDTFRLVVSIVACVVLKVMNRRSLALLSGVGTSVSLLILGLNKMYPVDTTVIPLLSLVGFVAFVTVGFVPLPWTMMGEVFPLANRGLGSGISALTTYVAFFSVVKTAPDLMKNFGMGETFLLYSSVAFALTVFLYAFLPETKDKALYQIEDKFKTNGNDQTG